MNDTCLDSCLGDKNYADGLRGYTKFYINQKIFNCVFLSELLNLLKLILALAKDQKIPHSFYSLFFY